jgi:hypothetical protein
MPRLSNLEKIQNETLAKLNTLRNVLDGRTDAAYRRKIFGSTIGKVTKLLEEITAISKTVKPVKKEVVKKEVVNLKGEKKVIVKKAPVKRISKKDINEIVKPVKELYKFSVKFLKTDVFENEPFLITVADFNKFQLRSKLYGTASLSIVEEYIATSANIPKKDKNGKIDWFGLDLMKVIDGVNIGEKFYKAQVNEVISEIPHRGISSQIFTMTTRGVKVNKKKNVVRYIYKGPLIKPYKYNMITSKRFNTKYETIMDDNTVEDFSYMNLNDFLNIAYFSISDVYGKMMFVITEAEGIIRVNEGLPATQTDKVLIPMKKGVIIKNTWLKYAESIAKTAYDVTDDICVYHQLSNYFLNPPSGRPSPVIDGEKMSPENLYNFLLKQFPCKFAMTDGVHTNMIATIAAATKRSLYAYDFEEQCFFKQVTSVKNSNYCPIVYYMANGHMYLLDTKEAIKSVIERSKSANKAVVSQEKKEESKKDKKDEIQVYTYGSEMDFNGIELGGVNCKQLPKGVHIVNKSGIILETVSFIKNFLEVPQVSCKSSTVNSIRFKNENKEVVSIECDANTMVNQLDYKIVKGVADANGIDYVNQGIGYLVTNILNKHFKPKEFQPDEEAEEILEEEHEEVFKTDEMLSFFNNNVFTNVINTKEFKTWAFIETVKENAALNRLVNKKFEEHGEEGEEDYKQRNYPVKKIDVNKCRRNILYFSKYDFPVFSVMDTVKTFEKNDKINVGYYYVITENVFPFRGCGWYSQPMVLFGLEEKLIDRNDIKFKLESSKTIPKEQLKKMIDVLLRAFESAPCLQKLCINAFIGMMGKIKNKSDRSVFTLCKYEASNLLCNANTNILTHYIDEDNKLYQSRTSKKNVIENTMFPVYTQIVQMEAIELYKIEKIIKENDGKPLDRNTDAVRFFYNKNFEIDGYFWDDEKTVKKYKWEKPKPLCRSSMEYLNREDDFKSDTFGLMWNISKEYEGDAMIKAIQIVESNKLLHIDGRAGTGKSYLTNKIIEVLHEKEINFVAYAPTNKAARIINGETIDTLYHVTKTNKSTLSSKFKNIDIIIIDEISMMKEKFYNMFVSIKKIKPTIKFIITGDFEQFKPVKDTWDGDYKNSAGLFELCDGNRLQLSKNRRSDEKLYNICKNVNDVNIENFPVREKTYLNIAYRHKTRIQVNKQCIERFIKENEIKHCLSIDKDEKNPKTQDVKIFNGLPVICHKTRNTEKAKADGTFFLNSERFTVAAFDYKSILMKGYGREFKISISEFHTYFFVGFCITAHASQGETFSEKYTIFDWDFIHFSKRAKYVSLSRATAYENIQINQ